MATPGNTPGSRPGAVPVGGGSSRPKWLIPLLIGLVLLIALILLLSQCGGDDDETTGTSATTAAATTAAAVPPATATSAAASATAPAGTGPSGTVTAGGANLLSDVTSAGLGSHDGEEAIGKGVEVQSVPADEGFWIGTSGTDRLWIQLTDTGGESDYKVKQGDTVDFTATVTRAAADFAGKTGLTAAEGADQLSEQGHYLSVKSSTVKLSS